MDRIMSPQAALNTTHKTLQAEKSPQDTQSEEQRTYDFRPRVPPRDYHSRLHQAKSKSKTTFVPTFTGPLIEPLNESQKRKVILDSLERTRQQSGPSLNVTPRPNQSTSTASSTAKPFTHAQQQAIPPDYLQRQKEIKKRYSLKGIKKRLSSSNDVNAIIDSSIYPKFCFTQANILTTNSCIAHCVSSDFKMGKGLASAIARCYPAIQEMRQRPLNHFPPGSMVAYFDHRSHKFIYNLVTKHRFFHKPSYETLELSLQALRHHLERNKVQDLAIPKLGCGYDQLHWPTVFSLIFKVFCGLNLTITIFQPTR